MNSFGLVARNLVRHPLRTASTVAGVAIAFIAFVLLRTVIGVWDMAGEVAASDRIGTRHKLSFMVPLPRRYVDIIRETEGVREATWVSWFGGKDALRPSASFASFAVDPASFLTVYDELVLPDDQRTQWLADRQGALVGDLLARQLGLKVGDRFTMQSEMFPGDWTVHVAGIFHTSRNSFDRNALLLHWSLLNEALPSERRDMVGWVVSRVDAAGKGPWVAEEIDRTFDQYDHRTRTMSERQLNLSFVARFASVMQAIKIMSAIVLLIVSLVLANTIAMSVRERASEYGALRALGFRPRQLGVLIVGESALLGVVSGALGVGLAQYWVEHGVARFMEESSGGMFPFFRVAPSTIALALVASLLLGVAAGLWPALETGRMTVARALRRED